MRRPWWAASLWRQVRQQERERAVAQDSSPGLPPGLLPQLLPGLRPELLPALPPGRAKFQRRN